MGSMLTREAQARATPAATLLVLPEWRSDDQWHTMAVQEQYPCAPLCSPCRKAHWTVRAPAGNPANAPAEGACKAWNKWAARVVMDWSEAAREATKERLTRERATNAEPTAHLDGQR